MKFRIFSASVIIASYVYYPFFAGAAYSLSHYPFAPLIVPFMLFVFPIIGLGNEELPIHWPAVMFHASIYLAIVASSYFVIKLTLGKFYDLN